MKIALARSTSNIQYCWVRECILLDVTYERCAKPWITTTHVHICSSNVQEQAFTLLDRQRDDRFILLRDAVDTSKRWVDS
jgi:hypothetical protein